MAEKIKAVSYTHLDVYKRQEQAHAAERIKKTFPFVNLVFGTNAIHRLPELLSAVLTDRRRVFVRGAPEATEPVAEGLPIRRDGKYKAWLTVMYGCNNFCSYCVVPRCV